MTDLIESGAVWPDGVYQLEVDDPVVGGAPNKATGAGMSNIPHKDLADRTSWLKGKVDQLLQQVVAASLTVAGIVRLSSAVNSTSETLAATPKAVKAAYDNAETRALKATTVIGGGLAVGGGTLDQNRVIMVRGALLAEAQAGADNTTVMTPLRTKQAVEALFPVSIGGQGYQRLASGLIIQWGTMTETSGNAVVFPLAFPNACLSLAFADLNVNGIAETAHIIGYRSLSASAFVVSIINAAGSGPTSGFSYIAIGN